VKIQGGLAVWRFNQQFQNQVRINFSGGLAVWQLYRQTNKNLMPLRPNQGRSSLKPLHRRVSELGTEVELQPLKSSYFKFQRLNISDAGRVIK